MTSVSLVAVPETTPTSLYGLLETLSAAGNVWTELTGEPSESPRMQVRIVSSTSELFTSVIGVPFAPHASFDQVPESDVIVVTDLALAMDEDPRGSWPQAAPWIKARFDEGATVCSVCTGSVLLAEAGVLDGAEATSHWSAIGLFADYYPAVRLKPERILSPSGPEHRVITCGGMASWEELALYLLARYCGEAEAVRIAKVFLLGDRSEGQLPFAAMARRRRHEDAVIGQCQSWVAEHYDEPHPVARMTTLSGLTERTFTRRFRAATGYGPVEYVQTLRIEEAKQLIETTDTSLEAVARRVGYEDVTFFRRLFKRHTGVTPARYRQRYRRIVQLRETVPAVPARARGSAAD
jgi:transcriptional regulator GlxA family with amidase domain